MRSLITAAIAIAPSVMKLAKAKENCACLDRR